MTDSKIVKPYYKGHTSKKEEVAEMFDNIAGRYDFLNHFFSLGIDKIWRRRAIRILGETKPKKILDIATGTGDFAFAAIKLSPDEVIGVDISQGMLDIGISKIKKRGLDKIIKLQLGDSEKLEFADNEFEALTVGFGVRNFENLEKGLSEMLRVVAENGRIVILEFSKPKKFPVKQFFRFYSNYLIPFFGKRISKDGRAYTYLPESVEAFPEGDDFINILRRLGYQNVKAKMVSGGIATIYSGDK